MARIGPTNYIVFSDHDLAMWEEERRRREFQAPRRWPEGELPNGELTEAAKYEISTRVKVLKMREEDKYWQKQKKIMEQAFEETEKQKNREWRLKI